jgi:aurora kinase
VPEKESPASEVNGQFKKKNVYLNHDLSKQQHYEINKMVTIPPPPNHESAKIAEQAKLLLSIKAEYLPRQFSKADFAIGRRMGKGQFGEVMMVIHRATGFLCGMKVMSKKQIR